MSNPPEVWTFEALRAYEFNNAALWTLGFLKDKATAVFALPIIEEHDVPPVGLGTLLVIGGGVLMDRAKYWRARNSPDTKLIVVPSIWGSGAENSRIAVLNDNGRKAIHVGVEYLPDVRAVWTELAQDIPERLATYACGDVLAHALEGFLSPVGHDDTRLEMAGILNGIVKLPAGNDPAWFEFSARACAGQAATSAGLVHGIAHTLEGLLHEKYPDRDIGHAQLCSTYLWPVFCLNMKHTDKIKTLFGQYGIGTSHVIDLMKKLYDEELYRIALPILVEHWYRVLREPPSRTNCVLVRSSHIEHFKEGNFE